MELKLDNIDFERVVWAVFYDSPKKVAETILEELGISWGRSIELFPTAVEINEKEGEIIFISPERGGEEKLEALQLDFKEDDDENIHISVENIKTLYQKNINFGDYRSPEVESASIVYFEAGGRRYLLLHATSVGDWEPAVFVKLS